MAKEYIWKCKNKDCRNKIRLTDGILISDRSPDSPMRKSIENGDFGEVLKAKMVRFPKDRIRFNRIIMQCPKCNYLCERFTFKTNSPSYNYYVVDKYLHYPCPQCGHEMESMKFKTRYDYPRIPCPRCGGVMERNVKRTVYLD